MRGIFGGLNGALVREQWRAQRRYTLTAGVMVALATGLAAFTLSSLATSAAVSDEISRARGYDAEHLATLNGWSDGPGIIDGETWDDWNSVTPEEASAIADDARAQGIDVTTSAVVYANLDHDETTTYLAAVEPTAGTDMLYSGRLPGPGEVALASRYAELRGYAIGDAVTVTATSTDGVPDAPPVPLTLVGLIKSVGYEDAAADSAGLISPESVDAIARTGGFWPMVNEAGERTGRYDITFAWDGPMIDALAGDAQTFEGAEPLWSGYLGVGEWLAVLGAALLATVAVGAALAAGRAQGEARTQWVATARALGATRRDIVTGGIVEGLAVGLVAGAVGIVAGWAAEAWAYAATGQARPDIFGPGVAVLPWGYAAVLWGLAMVLALVIGLVPALWASRVAPSAALSPRGATHQRDAEPRSRRVPLTWLAGIGALALAVAAGNPPSTTGGIDAIAVGAWIAVAVVAAALGVLAVRAALPHVSGALARTGRPSLVLASHALHHRTGGLTAAATGLLLAAGLTFGAVETTVMATALAYDDDLLAAGATLATWDLVVDALLAWWLGGALLLMAGGFMVGLAEWMGRGAALREAATAGALGLDRHGRQIAAIARVAVPMGLGVLAGTALGLLGVATFEVWEQLGAGASTILARDLPVLMLRALVAALGILAGGAAGVGVASLFAARGVDARSPQEAERISR
ncbi:FtsX-like permease family protein [Demequina gelatinilytica]|uniref:FtsX-like permease family protein n=1 Tax=Demequina gelatinilytica TaxID=1638980 RepID=UPI000AA49736|nr:ABC transporter permease [Demequina gelatinilytica]